jgi:hypothetical protein
MFHLWYDLWENVYGGLSKFSAGDCQIMIYDEDGTQNIGKNT